MSLNKLLFSFTLASGLICGCEKSEVQVVNDKNQYQDLKEQAEAMLPIIASHATRIDMIDSLQVRERYDKLLEVLEEEKMNLNQEEIDYKVLGFGPYLSQDYLSLKATKDINAYFIINGDTVRDGCNEKIVTQNSETVELKMKYRN